MAYSLLDGGNGLARIQALGASLGAVHDGVATVQLEGVVQLSQSLSSHLITRVLNPAEGLHQHSRTQVVVRSPPVRGAGGGAASTQNALVHTIQLLAVLLALQELAVGQVVGALDLGAQPGLDGLVLVVEVGQISHQVLDHIHVRKRVDLGGLRGVLVNIAQAGQGVGTIDVHGATSANTLTARATEGQGRIDLILDLDKGIQNHGSALVQVHLIGGNVGLLLLLGVPAVDFEILHVGLGRKLSQLDDKTIKRIF